MTTLAVLGVLILVGFAALSAFQGLARLRDRVEPAFARLDAHVTQRHGLVASLVEAAPDSVSRKLLEATSRARAAAAAALRVASADPADRESLERLARAESRLVGNVARLRSAVGASPRRILEELDSADDRVALALHEYNRAAGRYNRARASLPNSLVARLFSLGPAEILDFGSPEMAATAPPAAH